MRRAFIISIFVVTQVLLIFLHIHKKGIFTKVSYENQRIENSIKILQKEKDLLSHQMQRIKNPSNIKKYAQEKLGMQSIKLSQIKIIPEDNG